MMYCNHDRKVHKPSFYLTYVAALAQNQHGRKVAVLLKKITGTYHLFTDSVVGTYYITIKVILD